MSATRTILKPWQGHNSALLAGQIRSASGATNKGEMPPFRPRGLRSIGEVVAGIVATVPSPVEPDMVPAPITAGAATRADRLYDTLVEIARNGEIVPVTADLMDRMGVSANWSSHVSDVLVTLEQQGRIIRTMHGNRRDIEIVEIGMVVSNRRTPVAVVSA